MTTQTTDPAPAPWERMPLSGQRRAHAALDRIIELHPNLPAAHIILHRVYPDLVDVQAHSWDALEKWRVALNVAPAEVRPGNCAPERQHIEFETSVDSARVRVWVMGDLVEQPAVEAAAVSS